MTLKKCGLIAGVFAPLNTLFIVACAGFITVDYSHINNFMSELGAVGSTTKNIMNFGGFYPISILLFCFAISFPYYFDLDSKIKKWASILLIIHAFGILGAGVFSCDTGCPVKIQSLSHNLHYLTSGIAIYALIISISLWGVVYKKTGNRSMFVFSQLSVAVSLVALFLIGYALQSGYGAGLFQRILFASMYLWVFVASVCALKSARLTSVSN